MAGRFAEVTRSFRKTFSLPNKEITHWFPGHMNTGMNQIQKTLKHIDCVIEIHDARIPFSGRNPRFSDLIALKPHILVLSKVDLINTKKRDNIVEKLKQQGCEKVFFMNCTGLNNKVIKHELFPAIQEVISLRPRYHRQEIYEFNAMVIGVPNVGKSTFLNNVRNSHTKFNSKGAHVGAVAGITKHVTRMRVGYHPDIFLVDTPGILTPSVPDVETGMRLALCSCFPDHLVGLEYIVDYLLFWLNKNGCFEYVEYFGLKEPTEDVFELLALVAVKNKKVQKKKSTETGKYVYHPDFEQAAHFVLRAFRMGKLGKHMLDEDRL